MKDALGWIFKVSGGVSLVLLLVILASGNASYLDGFLAGAVISLASLLLFKITTERLLDKENPSPWLLLVIMPVKLLFVVGVVFFLLVQVKVSTIGLVIGLGNVPIAVFLHGIFASSGKIKA